MPPLPGLSSVAGKPLIARFDGGQLSSDAGVVALHEVDRRLGVADRLAACIDDPRLAGRVRHEIADILRFRLLMIAAGYEDANDADSLRRDPAFKLAVIPPRLAVASDVSWDGAGWGGSVCAQSGVRARWVREAYRSAMRCRRASCGAWRDESQTGPRRRACSPSPTRWRV